MTRDDQTTVASESPSISAHTANANSASATSPETAIETLISEQLAQRFELRGLLGKGGMGQVFKALDLQLEREVAIKAIHPRLLRKPGIYERLRDEARITARLQHPNIVQVFDFIELSGHYLMIMEFVEGHDLKAVIDKGLTKRSELIEKFVDVCDAVHYAHQQGIIHRDLKPHNIMLTPSGDIKIMDFGISHIVNEDISSPQNGKIEGSPVFMAPELFDNQPVSTAADVYALGVSLFYALTSQVPYSGTTGQALIFAIVSSEIPDPSSLHGKVSADMDAICHKACAHDLTSRYDSAAALADDLRRSLQGLPVNARQYSLGQSLQKSIALRPLTTLFSLVIIAVLFIGIYMSSDYVHRISEKTLINTLHLNVGNTAVGSSLSLDTSLLKRMLDQASTQPGQFLQLDAPLSRLQHHNRNIRDFYILRPANSGDDFSVFYARHGDGPLNMVKLKNGHDTWEAKPLVSNAQARGLMAKVMLGHIVIQEEFDVHGEQRNDWKKRMLGYAPIKDATGAPFAILVVEVSSGGIAEAYQHIEDAYNLASGLAIIIAIGVLIGTFTTLILLWKSGSPQ